MKLDKRKCRKYADPELKMRSGSGILCAGQIDYIVRTAVKNISRQRILVLYVYSRGQAAKGDFQPVWTVFQGRDDFITLERREDGSTAWRKSSFNRLDSSWDLSGKSAFYSTRDEMRVSRYFKSGDSGFQALSAVQTDIQARRWKERQITKEREIISRVSCVKALPHGLKDWIHKSVMPSYFFYDYKRSRSITGTCSSCGKESMLSGVKQGVRKICPHCHKELVCKPRSRKGKCMFDRDTVQVIQSTGDGTLVLRIVKIYHSYKNADVPEISIYENARHFVYMNPDNKRTCCESYYYSYNSGFLTGWKKGDRPTFSPWQYSFEADVMGWLYTGNLPGSLSGAWKYCPIADFYGWLQKPFLVLPFLYAYLEHPCLEHLVKTGFFALVSNLVYDYGKNCLDETQHRTHRILQTAAEDVDFLRSMNPDMHTLKTFQEYAGLKGRQELLAWQLEHKVSRDIQPVLKHMTPHKYMRYLDRQYAFLKLRKTSIGGIRYKNMQDLAMEYRDYLEICENLKYDLKNSFVLYPEDLQKSHDRAAKSQKQKDDARIRRGFNAAYRKIKGRLDFEYSGMKIILPSTPNEVVKEGHALHHCVGSYIDRVARLECIIVFLRQCGDPSRPFYTVEIRGHEISQVRGLKNCSPEPEVKAFIKAWEKQVLSRLDIAA